MSTRSDLNPFQSAPVLVTGGCGFIGSHLVEALVDRGAHVAVLDNLQAGKWSNLDAVGKSAQRIEGDIRDRALVERVTRDVKPRYVFHLAANASVPGSVQEPVYDFETNCNGTFVVLDALRAVGGCERIVTASSGAVYGEPVRFPIEETDALRPISPYGASKLASEIEAEMFRRVYGVPVVVARLFNSYGPRMARFVVLDFLRKLRADPARLEVLGSGQQVRDFTYVADTVQGLLILAAQGVPGDAYNVSSGSTCSVRELAYQIIQAVGLEGRTEVVYTGQSWVGDAQRWEVSINKLRELGYRPQFDLARGIAQVIAWFDLQTPESVAATGASGKAR